MNRLTDENFNGLRATLVGLGRRTNVALARYLVRRGARVRFSEQRPREQLSAELALLAGLPVEVCAGGHQDEHVLDADVVFVSPGVPRDLPMLESARRHGVHISSEIELLFERCAAPILGITGSAGKTTTTSLVDEMLRTTHQDVFVGGNIGIPLIERVDDIPAHGWVVLELSSFQLETLQHSARIGAILNVTPNHLERHPSFEHYRDSKFNLLRYQNADDIAVLGLDDPVAASLAQKCSGQVRWFSHDQAVRLGAYRQGHDLWTRDELGSTKFAAVGDLKLKGRHNVLNVLAAATLARATGVSPAEIGRVAADFVGVEHRLEFVRSLDGVLYYNDSIATAPERTCAALRAIDKPIVLIAGGRSKHLPMEEMARLVCEKTRAVVTLGEMAGEITAAIRNQDDGRNIPIVLASSIEEAVQEARQLAQANDVVLLSPAGTSYDQFRDFEERGNRFKAAVLSLVGEPS